MESLDSQKLSCKSQGCSDSFGKCQMLFLWQDSSFGPSADLIRICCHICTYQEDPFHWLVKMSHRFVNHEAFFREIPCILTRAYRLVCIIPGVL